MEAEDDTGSLSSADVAAVAAAILDDKNNTNNNINEDDIGAAFGVGLRQRRGGTGTGTGSTAGTSGNHEDVFDNRDSLASSTSPFGMTISSPFATGSSGAASGGGGGSGPFGAAPSDGDNGEAITDMEEACVIDQYFVPAAAATFGVWVLLLIIVYTLIPVEHRVYLDPAEQQTAQAAFCIMIIAFMLWAIPVLVLPDPKLLTAMTNTTTAQGPDEPGRSPRIQMSGILVSALVVQIVSISTNGLLAFCPTMVMVDHVTRARVYLIRWCEWIPLSGLMTFLSEAVDVRKSNSDQQQNSNRPQQRTTHHRLRPSSISTCALVGLSQSLSCVCGIIFPYVSWHWFPWSVVMTVALVTYLVMFPRLWYRRKTFLKTQRETTNHNNNNNSPSILEMEALDRTRFAYHLILACTVVWTLLVVAYFLNMAAHILLPPGHPMASGAMVVDTVFDVIAKALYMKIIMEAHIKVFDSERRAKMQLAELRRLMTALWESSSDIILVSVQQHRGQHVTSLLSPAFATLILDPTNKSSDSADESSSGSPSPPTDKKPNGKKKVRDKDITPPPPPPADESPVSLLLLDTKFGLVRRPPTTGTTSANTVGSTSRVASDHPDDLNPQEPKQKNGVAAFFVDAAAIPMDGNIDPAILAQVNAQSLLVKEANKVVNVVWNSLAQEQSSSSSSFLDGSLLVVHEVQQQGGLKCHCEIKVKRHSTRAVIAVVRNVTERYRRFQAEQRAHAESLARQRDAQAVNRFTRHEVKNGLLAGIELCESLKAVRSTTGGEDNNAPFVDELQKQLDEILDTVLTEATARDVIHEVYQPKLEAIDVPQAVAQTSLDGFPIEVEGDDKNNKGMPLLMLDPQLLRYIHRNAVSNACKYGKAGGRVLTRIRYDERTEELVLRVFNEPGPGHERLLQMGAAACSGVFVQGKRLAPHQASASQISSGDGAWIMQKCAKTLRGHCHISFEKTETIFTFKCHATMAEGNSTMSSVTMGQDEADDAAANFVVPMDTWAIAIDDSKIQRQALGRILAHSGVEESKTVLLGKSLAEVEEFPETVRRVVRTNATSRVLILVDEVLDFPPSASSGFELGEASTISGSIMMQKILNSLEPSETMRVLALIRSANDNEEDLELYSQRAHGYFPKMPMKQREKVSRVLEPLWRQRFGEKPPPPESKHRSEGDNDQDNDDDSDHQGVSLDSEDDDDDDDDDDSVIGKKEVLEALDTSVAKIERLFANSSSNPKECWKMVSIVLHTLKAEMLIVEECPELKTAVSLIDDLRGTGRLPSDFDTKWQEIQGLVRIAAETLP